MKKFTIISLIVCAFALLISIYDICHKDYFEGIIGLILNFGCIAFILYMERREKNKFRNNNIYIENLLSRFGNSTKRSYIRAIDVDKNVLKKLIDHLATHEHYETCAILQKIVNEEPDAQNIQLQFNDREQSISFFLINSKK